MYRGVLKIVLIALVIAPLLGIGVVAVLRWRESANRLRCQNNLRIVGWFAMWQYADREFAFPGGPNFADRTSLLREDRPLDPNKSFPLGTIPNATLPPSGRLAWQVSLLPYMQREELSRRFDLTKGWNDDSNRDARMARVTTLACPSLFRSQAASEPWSGHYMGVTGIGTNSAAFLPADPRAGFFHYDWATTTGMVRRGFSHTLTILESERDHGPWPAGGRPTLRGLDSSDLPYIGIGRQFGGHRGGCNAAFADGSVRFQSHTISPGVLELLATLSERSSNLP